MSNTNHFYTSSTEAELMPHYIAAHNETFQTWVSWYDDEIRLIKTRQLRRGLGMCLRFKKSKIERKLEEQTEKKGFKEEERGVTCDPR